MMWLSRRIARHIWNAVMAEPVTYDLSFINKDVDAQLERSHEIVKIADALNSLLPKVEDPAVKATLQENIKSLLGVVSGLTANATSTSTAAVLSIVSSKKP